MMSFKFIFGDTLKIAEELYCCYRLHKSNEHRKLCIKQKIKSPNQNKIIFNSQKGGQKIYYRYERVLNGILEQENGDRIFSFESNPNIITDQWNIQILQITLAIDIPHGDYFLYLTEIGFTKREIQVMLNYHSQQTQFQASHQLQLGTEKIQLQIKHVSVEDLRSESAFFEIDIDNLGCYSNQLILEIGDKIDTLIQLFQSIDPYNYAEQNKEKLNGIYPNLYFFKVEVENLNLEQKMKDTLVRFDKILPQLKKSQNLLLNKPGLSKLKSAMFSSQQGEQMKQSTQASQTPNLKRSINQQQGRLPTISESIRQKSQQFKSLEQDGRFLTEAQANDYTETVEAFMLKFQQQSEIIKEYEQMLIKLKSQVEDQEQKLDMHQFLTSSLKDDMNRIIQNISKSKKPVLEQQLSMQIQKIEQVEAKGKEQQKNLHQLVDLLKSSIKKHSEDNEDIRQSANKFKQKILQNKVQQQEIYDNLERIVKEIQDDRARIKQYLNAQDIMKKSMSADQPGFMGNSILNKKLQQIQQSAIRKTPSNRNLKKAETEREAVGNKNLSRQNTSNKLIRQAETKEIY